MDVLILEISTRGLHRYETLGTGKTTIGRALDNDIILSDPTVAPHHLQIVQHADNSVELINLTNINPTRLDRHRLDTQVIGKLPVELVIGRVQATLQSREQPVAATRPLPGNRSHRHPSGHAYWTLLLVLACLLVGGLDFFLSSYNSFKWGDLLKHLLRETILVIGGFSKVGSESIHNGMDARELAKLEQEASVAGVEGPLPTSSASSMALRSSDWR